MIRADILIQVRQIVAEAMEIPAEEIEAATNIRDDLGADDIDAHEIIYAIEDAWPPVEFSDAEMADCRTVGDLVGHLAEKLGLVEVAA